MKRVLPSLISRHPQDVQRTDIKGLPKIVAERALNLLCACNAEQPQVRAAALQRCSLAGKGRARRRPRAAGTGRGSEALGRFGTGCCGAIRNYFAYSKGTVWAGSILSCAFNCSSAAHANVPSHR